MLIGNILLVIGLVYGFKETTSVQWHPTNWSLMLHMEKEQLLNWLAQLKLF